MKKNNEAENNTKSGMTRRSFIGKTSLAAAAITIVPRHVLGGKGFKAPSDTLNVACIGIGGKGTTDSAAMEGENVVALCDIDDLRGKDTRLKYPNARFYNDFRELFDKEKNIDAVTVSTPDHNHAIIAMAKAAIRLIPHHQAPACST